MRNSSNGSASIILPAGLHSRQTGRSSSSTPGGKVSKQKGQISMGIHSLDINHAGTTFTSATKKFTSTTTFLGADSKFVVCASTGAMTPVLRFTEDLDIADKTTCTYFNTNGIDRLDRYVTDETIQLVSGFAHPAGWFEKNQVSYRR